MFEWLTDTLGGFDAGNSRTTDSSGVQKNSWLDFDNLGQFGSLATGLAGAYNAYNQNKMQKEAFKFQKGTTNRNIANQAVVVNNDLANQVKMQSQMFGNKVGTQDYRNYVAQNQQRVNGSPI